MRIAITGSNGFLGKKYINFNKKNVLKLPSVKNYKNKNFYTQKNKIRDLLNKKNIDIVIHFAGIRKNECQKNFKYAHKYIYNLTKHLVEETNNTKKKIKFIYISTDHVFDGSSKFYKESNLKNLNPKTSLGILKLKAENFVKNNSKNWLIIRLSAIMDDPRLSNFVSICLKKKIKINLYSNVYFTPVLSVDLFNMIDKIINYKISNKILHCSGNKRINKYNFYSFLYGKNIFFKKKKIKKTKFYPADLSLSNKLSSSLLNLKFTNFERSIKISRVNIAIK